MFPGHPDEQKDRPRDNIERARAAQRNIGSRKRFCIVLAVRGADFVANHRQSRANGTRSFVAAAKPRRREIISPCSFPSLDDQRRAEVFDLNRSEEHTSELQSLAYLV